MLAPLLALASLSMANLNFIEEFESVLGMAEDEEASVVDNLELQRRSVDERRLSMDELAKLIQQAQIDFWKDKNLQGLLFGRRLSVDERRLSMDELAKLIQQAQIDFWKDKNLQGLLFGRRLAEEDQEESEELAMEILMEEIFEEELLEITMKILMEEGFEEELLDAEEDQEDDAMSLVPPEEDQEDDVMAAELESEVNEVAQDQEEDVACSGEGCADEDEE